MDALFALFSAAFIPMIIIGVFVSIFIHSKKLRERRRALYQGLAQRYGGHVYESSGGLLSSVPDVLALPLQGWTVYLDMYVVSHGKSSTTYQRAVVLAPHGERRQVDIYKETPIFSALGKAFGGQDIQVADPEFDRAFIIKGNDEPWLRQALSAPTRQAHLRLAHMRVSLSPASGLTSATALLSAAAQQVLKVTHGVEPAGDPGQLARSRASMSDGVLTVLRVGETLHEQQIMEQMTLAASYAQDLLSARPLLESPSASGPA